MNNVIKERRRPKKKKEEEDKGPPAPLKPIDPSLFRNSYFRTCSAEATARNCIYPTGTYETVSGTTCYGFFHKDRNKGNNTIIFVGFNGERFVVKGD